jgi:hypothetical protein
VTAPSTRTDLAAIRQKVGGIAALYLAAALVAAIPYFLLVVDYPDADTASAKVELIVDNLPSLYAMYLASYVLFGIALVVLALALWDRLRADAPSTMRIALVVGLLWSFALVASGLIFLFGMTTVEDLAQTEHAQAVLVWQAIEPVAMALGGGGGEVLGGLWVLLVSTVVLRGGRMSSALGWLGIVIGGLGLLSVVPPLQGATVGFGLLEIVWLAWVGVVLLRTRATAPTVEQPTVRSMAGAR